MMKFLQDDLGRIIGCCETTHRDTGIHEYGWRDETGILHVTGRARAVSPSSSTGFGRLGIDTTDPLTAWAICTKTGHNEPFAVHQIS